MYSNLCSTNKPLKINSKKFVMHHLLHSPTTANHHLNRHIRTFINARIKWVRDPYLDTAVEREKNLQPLLFLKTAIASQPSKTLPISTLSLLKPHIQLPIPALKFIQDYPLIFKVFLPPHKFKPLSHVKLTHRALSLHHDEVLLLSLSHYRRDVAERLSKILMLAGAGKLPLYLLDMLKFDLGLPHDYLLTLLPEFPDYFQICDMGFRDSNGGIVFGLQLVSYRDDLAVSVMQKRVLKEGGIGMRIKYSMNLPNGFDLGKMVLEWVDKWQDLPYISPYENAFHLAPNGDHVEKWAVGVIHELLSLLVSKKTDREIVFCLGEFWGFGRLRFKRALVNFPGILYVSNKIRTQTVVLREAFRENFLIEKHPLMVMRNKYIYIMNLVLRRGKPIRDVFGQSRKGSTSSRKGGQKKVDYNRISRSDIEEH